jgi:putative VirB-like lipoprotein
MKRFLFTLVFLFTVSACTPQPPTGNPFGHPCNDPALINDPSCQ